MSRLHHAVAKTRVTAETRIHFVGAPTRAIHSIFTNVYGTAYFPFVTFRRQLRQRFCIRLKQRDRAMNFER